MSSIKREEELQDVVDTSVIDDESGALAAITKDKRAFQRVSSRIQRCRRFGMKMIQYCGIDVLDQCHDLRKDEIFMVAATGAYGHRVMRYADPVLLESEMFLLFITCLDRTDVEENLCLYSRHGNKLNDLLLSKLRFKSYHPC